MSETLLCVRKTSMERYSSCPKGLHSFLERPTCKQLEYSCQNENLYKLQYSVRHKEHIDLPPLGAGRERERERVRDTSQRRHFDHVFTQALTWVWETAFHSRPAQRPAHRPLTSAKCCTSHFSYGLAYIVL